MSPLSTALVLVAIGSVLTGCAEIQPGTTSSPTCPDSGLTVTVSETDGAMGLRSVGLVVTNCSRRTREVKGYPTVGLLDEDQEPLALKVTPGVVGPGIVDPGPKSVVIEPGSTAASILTWRNTATDGRSSTGAFVAVTIRDEEPVQTLPLVVDAGTTGQVRMTAWLREGEGVV
jgi:hypothetical protein